MDPSTTTSKKSRAKSCTSCRQVKLRCDMRETFPAPCSRCRDRRQDCRMDSSFKRVGKRRQAEAPVNPSDSFQAALEGFSIGTQNPSPSSTTRSSDTYSPTQYYSNEKWLDFHSQSLDASFSQSWVIGEVVINYATAREVFQQFEEFYLPHIPILEPVTSLDALHKDSPFLFWGIIFVACRHMRTQPSLYARLHEPYQNLFGSFLTRQIHLLKDLHALLLICHWPFEIESQQDDPSWIHCGIAVNTALYLGLNRLEDDILFGGRRLKSSLLVSNLQYRRMTWMKCFQISTQLSTWYGLQYSAPGLQEISQFYDENTIYGEFIAMTEIQRQVGRSTTSLDSRADDGLVISLVPHFIHDLDDIKTRYSRTWSSAAEINLQAAKLYLFATCLILVDSKCNKPSQDSDNSIFLQKVLHSGHTAALRLIELTEELSVSKDENPSCSTYESGGTPILAQPKQHFRVAFFACCFLLKYLDCNNDTASSLDRDAARNGIARLHRTFMRFPSQPQLPRAASVIEVLGRAIVPNRRKMVNHIRTRRGASVMYNATWTAAELRERICDPEWIEKMHAGTESTDDFTVDTLLAPVMDEGSSNDVVHTDALGFDLDLELPPDPSFEYQFPWGVWNDALFDSLGFGKDGQLLSDTSVPMYNLL